MSLYHRYRPQTFEEMVGNESTISSLAADLKKKDKPHAILISGPTGCGKTTLGRMVASTLGCQGRDFHEIDITDLRGIDNIRDIRQQSRYKPVESACQVWLLDEVHRATGDSMSALLKALEDAPRHVYYVLATTDPQKLLPTILGRCSKYAVRPLTEKEMFQLLRRVVAEEGESVSRDVLDQIVQDSFGLPRNALQTLDQVLAVTADQRIEVAKKTAEMQSQAIELCRALMSRSGWKKVSSVLSGLKDEDPEKIRHAVLGYCQSVLLKKESDDAAIIIEELIAPLYGCGWPGLVFHCYSIVKR